jgi:hypothetical protein
MRRTSNAVRRSSAKDDELVLSEAPVLLSPFKVPTASRTAEVALPSPIPFVSYPELDPVAVIFLLMKAAKATPEIPFVNYQELDPAPLIFLLIRYHRHRNCQLEHEACASFIMMAHPPTTLLLFGWQLKVLPSPMTEC